MSNSLEGVGLRMLSVRKQEGFTQSVMAAKLDISDRTYNYYEQEKRELPTSVAIRFCDLFEVDLAWLLIGNSKLISSKQLEVLAASVAAVLDEHQKCAKDLSFDNLGQFAANIFERCSDGIASPLDEARKLFKMVE